MLTEAFRVWGVYFGFFTVSVSLCTVWPCNEFAGTATPGKNNSCFKCVQRFWQQTATTYSEDQIILKKYIFLICKNILLEKGILSCVICLVSLLLHVAAAKFWAHIDMHKKLTFEIRQRFAFAWFFFGRGGWCTALYMHDKHADCAWSSVSFQSSFSSLSYRDVICLLWLPAGWWWKISPVKWSILMLDLNNIQTQFYLTLVCVCLCASSQSDSIFTFSGLTKETTDCNNKCH